VNKNKLVIVFVLYILVIELVLGCDRVNYNEKKEEIETTTFAIEEETDTVQESGRNQAESETTTSSAANTIKTERLENSIQQTTQLVSNPNTSQIGEQKKDTISTTAKSITEESKADVTETQITTVEKTTIRSEKIESTTNPTSNMPTTSAPTNKPTPTTTPSPTPTPEFYNRVDTATFIQQAFAEVNRMRAEVGEEPVVMAPKLVQDYTMLRAEEEGAEGSAFHFNHIRPNGEFALDYLQYLFYDGALDKIAISENISTVGIMEPYSQNGDGMVLSFQESIDHYNNIISPDAGSVAIGYYYNEKVWLPYIVLIFLEK
jgi:uncharacterized protein YkwD